MQGGYNTYNKRPWELQDMLQLPKFSGNLRLMLEMKKRGKEIAMAKIDGQSPMSAFQQQIKDRKHPQK